jgi:sulfur-oxidizing protein SoxX
MIGLRALFLKAVFFSLVSLALGGCEESGTKVRGFILPEGDPGRGQDTFVALGCPACHTVSKTELTQPEDAPFSVQLGGKFLRVKHYGDLLTSIVNPDHRVLPPYNEDSSVEGAPGSPMPDFTQTMTVEQLIDVVEFLHGKYEKMPYYGGKYYYYQGYPSP